MKLRIITLMLLFLLVGCSSRPNGESIGLASVTPSTTVEDNQEVANAARDWLNAYVNGESIYILKNTCHKYRDYLEDNLFMSTILLTIAKDFGVSNRMEGDVEEILFTTQELHKSGGTVVNLIGTLYYGYGVPTSVDLNDFWVMEIENGIWKWCGTLESADLTVSFDKAFRGESPVYSWDADALDAPLTRATSYISSIQNQRCEHILYMLRYYESQLTGCQGGTTLPAKFRMNYITKVEFSSRYINHCERYEYFYRLHGEFIAESNGRVYRQIGIPVVAQCNKRYDYYQEYFVDKLHFVERY